jgi:hypothetical protein
MSGWTEEELGRLGEARELQLASVRSDGTLRPYVTMWGRPGRRRALRPIRLRPEQSVVPPCEDQRCRSHPGRWTWPGTRSAFTSDGRALSSLSGSPESSRHCFRDRWKPMPGCSNWRAGCRPGHGNRHDDSVQPGCSGSGEAPHHGPGLPLATALEHFRSTSVNYLKGCLHERGSSGWEAGSPETRHPRACGLPYDRTVCAVNPSTSHPFVMSRHSEAHGAASGPGDPTALPMSVEWIGLLYVAIHSPCPVASS